jgi:hypothetical protein
MEKVSPQSTHKGFIGLLHLAYVEVRYSSGCHGPARAAAAELGRVYCNRYPQIAVTLLDTIL